MTERARYAGAAAAPKPTATDDLGPRKTLFVLVVVAGCFAVLWPKVFYPMLVANANRHVQPSAIDKTTGCCDVISDTDVNTIRIMSELCGSLNPTACRRAVLETCGIDIAAALQERVDLGHSVRQILEEVRSLNGSLCLKHNFGVSSFVPHKVLDRFARESIRQERPAHLRSELVHPAFRERGRAIPHTEVSKSRPPPRIVEGRPGPLPGLRPAMGGAGHVVPPKQQGTGVMGLLMPLYTIGIVVFFTYTVMRLAFKKKPEPYPGAHLYPPVEPDEAFREKVFVVDDRGPLLSRSNSRDSKIVVDAMTALLDEVDRELGSRGRPLSRESIDEQDEPKPEPSVHVMGMETRESHDIANKWSRGESPAAAPTGRKSVPPPVEREPPQEIYLEGSLPAQSQLLVADSAIEAEKPTEDNSDVVLAGKMTLSVISLDSTENGNGSEDDKRTPSSHTSEEFEKIEHENIDQILDEAQIDIGQKIDDGKAFLEEIEKLNREIKEDIAKRRSSDDILEEIKKEFKLEDDLVKALSDDTVVTPPSDILKEFLENEAKNEEIKDIYSEEINVVPAEEAIVPVLSQEQKILQEISDAASIIKDNIENEEINVLSSEEIIGVQKILQDISKVIENKEETNIPSSEEIKAVPTEEATVPISSNEQKILQNISNLQNKEESKVIPPEEIKIPPQELQISPSLEQKLQDFENKEEIIVVPPEEIKVAPQEARISPVLEQKLSEDISKLLKEAIDIHENIVPKSSEEISVVPSKIEEISDKTVQNIEDEVPEVPLQETSVSNEDIRLKNEEVTLLKEDTVPGVLSSNILEETSKKLDEILTEPSHKIDEAPQMVPSEEITVVPLPTEGTSSLNFADEISRVIGDLTMFNPVEVPEVSQENVEKVKRDLRKSMEDVGSKKEETGDILKSVLEDIAKAEEMMKSTIEVDEKDVPSTSQNVSDVLLKAIEDSRTFEEAVLVPEDKKNEEIKSSTIEDIVRGPLEVREEERRVEEEAGGEEEVIEEVEYEDESEEEEEDEEIANVLDRIPAERMNGDDLDQSKYGTTSSATVAENEISEEENEESGDEDEEIEEIIEYVDNTDEEGEEIIEVNEVVNHLGNGNNENEH